MSIELLLDARAQIGESPLWVAPEQALYWIDVKAPALHRLHHESGVTSTWTLPADIGGFALDGRGRAFVALRTGLYWLDLETYKLSLVASPPFDTRLVRFNESACDSAGRFWIGTMTDPVDNTQTDRTGLLHSFTTTEGLRVHLDTARTTNGMAWNIDDTVFYLAHSEERIIYEFEFDLAQGHLGTRRKFLQLTKTDGVPDGAAIDAEGGYWCAIHGAGELHRYTASGALDRVITLPISQPTMCCFTGTNLEYLCVTSARDKLDEEALMREPNAGGIFRLRLGIKGHSRNWRVI